MTTLPCPKVILDYLEFYTARKTAEERKKFTVVRLFRQGANELTRQTGQYTGVLTNDVKIEDVAEQLNTMMDKDYDSLEATSDDLTVAQFEFWYNLIFKLDEWALKAQTQQGADASKFCLTLHAMRSYILRCFHHDNTLKKMLDNKIEELKAQIPLIQDNMAKLKLQIFDLVKKSRGYGANEKKAEYKNCEDKLLNIYYKLILTIDDPKESAEYAVELALHDKFADLPFFNVRQLMTEYNIDPAYVNEFYSLCHQKDLCRSVFKTLYTEYTVPKEEDFDIFLANSCKQYASKKLKQSSAEQKPDATNTTNQKPDAITNAQQNPDENNANNTTDQTNTMTMRK